MQKASYSVNGKMNHVLQSLFQLLRSAGRVRGTLPLTVLKVLASLACHGKTKCSVYFLCCYNLINEFETEQVVLSTSFYVHIKQVPSNSMMT